MEQHVKSVRWLDYAVLAARLLLAFTFLSYGLAKLQGAQFGISPAELRQPAGQLNLFRLYWYLCEQEPFRSFVGWAQVLAGLLLLWHRTALLGALLLLPIAANILVADITYLKWTVFYWRLSYYLGLLLLIFWHYRARMRAALRALTAQLRPRYHYPWWAWALLPLAAAALEAVGALPRLAYEVLANPAQVGRQLASMGQQLAAVTRHLL